MFHLLFSFPLLMGPKTALTLMEPCLLHSAVKIVHADLGLFVEVELQAS